MQDQNISTIQKRVLSFVIDDIVVGIFLVIIFYDQITALGMQITTLDIESAQKLIDEFILSTIPIVIAVKILYHSLLIWQNGMTIGKYVAKIKVIDIVNADKPSFMQAFSRAVLRVIGELPLYAGFALALVTPKRQAFHDKLSNCVVVDV